MNWEVGQNVLVGRYRIEIVERLTPKQGITTKGTRFWLKDGCRVGEDYVYIKPATQADLDRIASSEIRRKLDRFNWDSLSLNVLQRIESIVDENSMEKAL